MVAPPGMLNQGGSWWQNPLLWSTLGQTFTGLGSGLLQGRNWGEGLGMGAQQAQHNMVVGQQQQMQREMFDLEKKKLEKAGGAWSGPFVDTDSGRRYQLSPEGKREWVDPEPAQQDLDSLIKMGPDGKPYVDPLVLDAKRQLAAAGRTTIDMPKPPPTIEERDQQILLTGDPASPEYAMAYARTFQNPDFVAGTDAQGRPIQTPIYLPVPPNIRQPSYMGGQGQATQAQPAGAPAGQPTTGQPLVVGESTVRNSPELRKLEQNFSRVGQSVKRYKEALETHGEGPTLKVTNPGGAALLEQSYNDLMLEAKNLYELGVLNGPDYQIMTTTLIPPTSAQAAIVGMPTFKKQIEAFERKLEEARASARAIYAPSTAQEQAAPANPWASKTNEEVLNELRKKGYLPGATP